jgi:acetyl-CoA C-acetyltransferase
MDPRTPVVVGGGQLNQRADPVEPVDMIVEVARRAAADSGAPGLAERADSVRIVGMLSWRYRNPGLLVGERLGAPVRHTVYTGHGGSHPQALVNDAAADILAGRCDVAVVGGAEAWRTRMALKAQGERPDWTRQGDDVPLPELRPEVAMRDETELAAGLDRPAYVYPLFEQALRISAGRTTKEHRRLIAELWARFSDVASRNPAAWMATAHTAEEIETPSPRNRMVSWPYTKLMVSNNAVEQAAAVIICSIEAARRAGVPEDRWVFLRSGAEAADTDQIAARPRLDGSPAIRAAGAAALAAAGIEVGELGPVDLYSCFPSAVQVAARELGLPVDDPGRPLTVTGGLTFAGGPWNNYSTHAIATMLDAVRTTQLPGLVTANSGYLTKHSLGVYAASPGAGFKRVTSPPPIGGDPLVAVATDYAGRATLESWTVRFDRDGHPEEAMAALRTPDGARALARAVEPEVVGRLVEQDCEGDVVEVRGPAFRIA